MTLPPSPPAPIETRLAMAADRPALLAFIRDHWSARHVFVDAPEVFDWQYAQPDGRLNMVMAAQGGVILGVLGEYLWRALDEARRRPRYVVEAATPEVGGDQPSTR